MIMSNKVLIFGVNGFVGSYIVDEFLDHGYELFGSDRAGSARLTTLSNYYQADLLDSERIQEIVSDVNPQMIINLAAISSVGLSWKIPQETMQVNVVGTLNILDGVRKLSSPSKVLLIGSSEEYAPSLAPLSEESSIDATNPYGISKVTQERFAEIYSQQYMIPIYGVRAFNHTGVGQSSTFVLPSWCKQIADIQISRKPGNVKVGNLEVVRDFSDVRDVVRAYRLLIESDNQNRIYNIGSGLGHSLKDILDLITSFCEPEVEIEVDRSLIRPTDVPYIVCDNEKARDDLNWIPEHSLYETLSEMFNYYLQQNR